MRGGGHWLISSSLMPSALGEALPGLGGASQRLGRRPRGQLEGPRPGVADLLERQQGARPVDRAIGRAPGVRRGRRGCRGRARRRCGPRRPRWHPPDRRAAGRCRRRGRCRPPAIRARLRPARPARRGSTAGWPSARAPPDTPAALAISTSRSRLCRAAPLSLSSREASLSGTPTCTTSWRKVSTLASSSVWRISSSARTRASARDDAIEHGAMQPAGVGAERGRRMDRGQRQPRVVEPLGELLDRGRIPVVEVRAQREQLDRVEAVRGDVDEVLPIEPVRVEQVSRDRKGRPGHGSAILVARPRRSNTACRAGHHASHPTTHTRVVGPGSLRCSSLTCRQHARSSRRSRRGPRRA